MATIYGSQILGSGVYGNGIYGSGYLSRKHLKRAIKYGSYYGGLAAPVIASSEATAAPIVHAPLYSSRFYSRGGYQSNYYGSYLHAPIIASTAAPVVTSTVAAPIYHSGYYSRKSAYFAHKAAKYGATYGNGIYGSHVLPVASDAAPVVSSAAPVIYGSHLNAGLYGSGYLSRKHLKRAIKYGSYGYGGHF
jgi:hypothetical protein